MGYLFHGLMALQLTFFATSAFADVVVLHTQSPEIQAQLQSSAKIVSGAYHFESFVMDLDITNKQKARAWSVEKFERARIKNPRLHSIVTAVATKQSRSPAREVSQDPIVLADQIAKYTGTYVRKEIVLGRDANEKKVTTAVLVSYFNGTPTHYTFLEIRGFTVDQTFILVNTLGALTGGIRFTPMALGSENAAIGYRQLLDENLSLRKSTTSKVFYAPESWSTTTSGRFNRVNGGLGHEVSLFQLPAITMWLHSLSVSNTLAYGIYKTGPIAIFSAAAMKSWFVAVSANTNSPEVQAKLQKMAFRNHLAVAVAERSVALLLRTGALHGPEAWATLALIGSAGVAKLYYDYAKAVGGDELSQKPFIDRCRIIFSSSRNSLT